MEGDLLLAPVAICVCDDLAAVGSGLKGSLPFFFKLADVALEVFLLEDNISSLSESLARPRAPDVGVCFVAGSW
jgi:hypothetical protein